MKKIKRPLLCGCLMLIAVIALHRRMVDPPPWEPQLPAEWEGQLLTVTGQVYEKEVRTLYGQEVLFLYLKSVTVSSDTESGDDESIPYISEQIIKDRLICQLAVDQAACSGASAGSAVPEQQIALGSRVAVQGRLELYTHATNPGEWDSADYNLITKVAGQLKQTRILGSDNGAWRIREGLYRCRMRLKDRLYLALSQKEASVLAEMLLGEKHGLDQEIKELYQDNGIAHVLAISGLHITLLGMSLYRLLRRCSCPIVPAAIAGGCMLLLYGSMVGWGISAVRSIGMYLIRMLGEIWGRQYDMLTAMGVLAAGMVCCNPRLVYHCGFLLSFGAVAGMGWLYPVMQESLSGGVIERMILRKRSAGSRESRTLKGLLLIKGLCRSLLASVCITLSTLPVQLYFFYQIPVYGTLLNLLVLPLMGMLLAGGLVLMALPFALPVRWAVTAILALYEGLCHMADLLPLNLCITGSPELWQIAGYYGI
ncbi:MAG: ComEC family competence protein, partial [Acetatifactor sp.]|nr:ComEC family competence protein [Acetatifactor sp.]